MGADLFFFKDDDIELRDHMALLVAGVHRNKLEPPCSALAVKKDSMNLGKTFLGSRMYAVKKEGCVKRAWRCWTRRRTRNGKKITFSQTSGFIDDQGKKPGWKRMYHIFSQFWDEELGLFQDCDFARMFWNAPIYGENDKVSLCIGHFGRKSRSCTITRNDVEDLLIECLQPGTEKDERMKGFGTTNYGIHNYITPLLPPSFYGGDLDLRCSHIARLSQTKGWPHGWQDPR